MALCAPAKWVSFQISLKRNKVARCPFNLEDASDWGQKQLAKPREESSPLNAQADEGQAEEELFPKGQHTGQIWEN